MMTAVIQTKPMMVPTIPKKPVTAKFSKNNDLRKLYPAEKIIGGKIIVKKTSPENYIYLCSP